MGVPASTPHAIGRYALYGELASGGMATVHLGRLLGPVGFTRTVAIKRLHPQFAKDPEFVAMFLDEARLAARIHHPNVVQTLDVVTADVELFLVMEYVQGEPLSRLRRLSVERKEPMPLRVVSSIVCGALHGLQAAHEAKSDRGESLGIIHRDVSPQNILVGTDGVARLLDFGVAKAIGRSHSTRDGRVKGKFAYMAPEHLRGEATQQSDIFAASVVLWEMLTGERLFAGDHEMEIAGKVLKGGVEPPSKHFDASLRGGATLEALAQLDALTLRGLALAPENRFESARAMAFALEACLGVASPAQVGSWVARVAGDALQKRAEMVAEIESNSAAVPRPELAERTRSTVHARAPGPADDDAPSQATSPTVSSAASPAAFAARGGRARTMVMTGGVAVILAAVGGAYVLRSGGSPSPVSPPRSASALPVRQELPTAASALPAPIETTATPDPSPSSLASAAPTPPSTTGRGQAVRRTPTPHKNHCDPPYTLDSDGRQHFKEECFH